MNGKPLVYPAVAIACVLISLGWISLAAKPLDLLLCLPPLLLLGLIQRDPQACRGIPRALWRLRFLFLAQLLLWLWAGGDADLVGAESLLLGMARLALLISAAQLLLPTEPRILLDGLYWWCGPLERCGLRGHLLATRLALTVHYSNLLGYPRNFAQDGPKKLPPGRSAGLEVFLQGLVRRLEMSCLAPNVAVCFKPASCRQPPPRAWLLPGALLLYYGACFCFLRGLVWIQPGAIPEAVMLP